MAIGPTIASASSIRTPESSNNTVRRTDIAIEGTFSSNTGQNVNKVDEITSQQALNGEDSAPSEIVDERKIAEEGAFIQTPADYMINIGELHPNIPMTTPSSMDREPSALDVPAEKICVDGQRVYFSRGVAGDSSFFVYQFNNSSFHVIAHLVFNTT